MLLVGCLAGLAFAVPLMQREQVAPVAAQAGTGIAGCASKRTGAVRLLSTPARRVGNRRPRRCRRNEVAISWSVTGAQGPRGPQGPPGAPVDPSTTILNQSAQAQAASLFLDGQLRTTGGLRLGSETRTTQPPLYPPSSPGLVVRPIRSTAAGDTLAHVGAVRIYLDNQDNVVARYDGPTSPAVSFSCVHVLPDASVEGTHGMLGGATAAFSLMFDGGTFFEAVSIRCALISTDGHQTDLLLSRPNVNSAAWQGFVTTTTNQ
jgi:hypothetical protein